MKQSRQAHEVWHTVSAINKRVALIDDAPLPR
jgi:hypothetical protein